VISDGTSETAGALEMRPPRPHSPRVCVSIRRRENAALSEDEVIAYCRASIAHYKAPRYVRLIDSFPMTVIGKAQKYLMRCAMMEEWALVEQRTA
jgi:fatty-acyl-CoA synthase